MTQMLLAQLERRKREALLDFETTARKNPPRRLNPLQRIFSFGPVRTPTIDPTTGRERMTICVDNFS